MCIFPCFRSRTEIEEFRVAGLDAIHISLCMTKLVVISSRGMCTLGGSMYKQACYLDRTSAEKLFYIVLDLQGLPEHRHPAANSY